MLVEVIAEDIANGVKTKCAECPAARAASRVAGYQVCVGPFDIWAPALMGTTHLPWSIRTPAAVRKWIADFDDGLPVGALSFDIPAAPPPPPKAEG